MKSGILLTIAIPTYNRLHKLKRLIENITNQNFAFTEQIELIISNNCSSDETSIYLESLTIEKTQLSVNIHNQNVNLGFDGNIFFLYNNAKGKYIWFFADDDLLLPNAITTIINTLKKEEPNVLLFSFGQPRGSTLGVFNFKDDLTTFYNKKDIVELSTLCPKVSTYVLLKSKIAEQDSVFIESQFGFGWMHLALTLSILNYSENPKLTIISKVLAECDDEFDMLRWSPSFIKDSYQVFKHSFVKKNHPSILKNQIHSAYINTIQFCFAAKVGALRVLNIDEYDELIKRLKFERVLFLFPKSLLQFLLLKMNLINMYHFLKGVFK
jgi:glycosyltransferase involved in cell wall biosynthesis